MTHTTKIDLWFWHFDVPPDNFVRWLSYLDETERARMARFVFERDQTRFTICRSRMRRILGQYTATDPRDIQFTTTGRDKPTLAGANPQAVNFNLTHTDSLACLAVTHGHAVGIDLEHTREIKDDFIAYTFNPAEHTCILALEPSAKQTAFFRFWTAKEAYLKAIGTGFSQSLKTFDVDVPIVSAPGEFVRGALSRIDDTRERQLNWHLYTFQATDHHIGAVAIAPPHDTELVIRTRWITPV